MTLKIIYYYTITFDLEQISRKNTVINNYTLVTVNKMFIYIHVLMHGKADKTKLGTNSVVIGSNKNTN